MPRSRPPGRHSRGRAAQSRQAAARKMPVICSTRGWLRRCSAISSAAISGSSVARKASFLQDRLGDRVFATGSHDQRRSAAQAGASLAGRSTARGCRLRASDFVADGVLRTWLADSAAARQLGIQPTGHAVRGVSGAPGAGPRIFTFAPGRRSREQLLAAFPNAILVTELIGQGVNGVTGDYSRGAAGFIVRAARSRAPLAEITIASNLIEMFLHLEPASDLIFRRGIDAPTMLIPEMTVASA